MPNNTPNEQLTTSSTGPADSKPNTPSTVELETALMMPPVVMNESVTAVSQGPMETTGQIVQDEEAIRRLVDAVGVRRPTSHASVIGSKGSALQTRQFWEGKVTTVRPGEFVAIVRDRTDPKNPDEEVTFDLEELSNAEDLPLVRPGASFYWIIGSERSLAGQQRNVSLILFRRMPRLSQSALTRAANRAQRLMTLMQP